MSEITDFLVSFAKDHAVLLLVLFFVEQALAAIPAINGNSTFQVIGKILTSLKDAILVNTPKPPVQ